MAFSSQSKLELFGDAVSQLVNCWSSLQRHVEDYFGGAEGRAKSDWLALAIVTLLIENDEIEQYELEDFLEEALAEEFDLTVPEDTIQMTSKLVCLFFRLCQESRVAELQQKLQALPRPACIRREDDGIVDDLDDLEEDSTVSPNRTSFSSQQHAPSATSQSTATSDDNMEVSEENTDPDGWQVICRGRRR